MEPSTSTKWSISNCKLQLQTVIKNLETLKNLKNENEIPPSELNDLMLQTTNILTQMERVPAQKIKNVIEKRKRKRKKAKLKRKLRRQLTVNTEKLRDDTRLTLKPNKPIEQANVRADTSNVGSKLHQQLRSYRDSTRFLRTFELLELLHMSRTQDEEATREFGNKLSKLRGIWNIILSENKQESTTSAQNIEDEWNVVLFGAQEKTFYKQKRSLTEFINVRRKWDSYISNNAKDASSIPVGWVLPPENADSSWQCYKIS